MTDVEDAIEPYKEKYKDMQKEAKSIKDHLFFFNKSSVPPLSCTTHCTFAITVFSQEQQHHSNTHQHKYLHVY